MLRLVVPEDIICFLQDHGNITTFSYSFDNKDYLLNVAELFKLNGSIIFNKENYPPYWIETIDSILELEKESLLSLKEGEYSVLEFRTGFLHIFPVLFGLCGFLTFYNGKGISHIYSKDELFNLLEDSFLSSDKSILHGFLRRENCSYDENNDPLEVVYKYVSFSDSMYMPDEILYHGYLTNQEKEEISSNTQRTFVPVSPMRWRLK